MDKLKMVIKLKSVLKSLHWQLIFRSLIWGLSLLWYWESGFNRFSLFVFLVLSFWLYVQPIFQTVEFASVFISLVVISPLVIGKLVTLGQAFIAIGFLVGIFYIILALKNLYIINRFRWYILINLVITYLFLLVLFLSDPSYLFWLKLIILFLTTTFLTRELLKVADRNGEWLIGLVGFTKITPVFLGFLMMESFWVIGFLPIGFINAATIALLLFFGLTRVVLDYGKFQWLDKKVFWEIGLLLVLIFLVLLLSKWTP